ncbi:MAG: hypothetical protein ACKVUT_08160 [Gaiella sp.]
MPYRETADDQSGTSELAEALEAREIIERALGGIVDARHGLQVRERRCGELVRGPRLPPCRHSPCEAAASLRAVVCSSAAAQHLATLHAIVQSVIASCEPSAWREPVAAERRETPR